MPDPTLQPSLFPTAPNVKICSKCLEDKPATTEYFKKYRAMSDGLHSWCRRCITKFHKERLKARYRDRRALELLAEGTHDDTDVIAQYKRQNGKCYYCRRKMGTIYGKDYSADHVIPLSRGGSDWPENIVAVHLSCNSSKGNKLPHEWPQGGRLL